MPETGVVVTFNDRTQQAYRAIGDAAFAAIKRHFQDVVLPAAREGSEVDTGKNRESLIIHAYFSKEGNPAAQIMSTSGYGGIIEEGFKHVGEGGKEVAGHPYIWPAFQQSYSSLLGAIRGQLAAINSK